MDITVFNEITTQDQLDALKAEAEKYTGLYVDMDDAKQRKYVKDQASDINTMLKKVDRIRIDSVKSYKMGVEKQAAHIKESLEIANLPFTLLIDEHKEKRAKILAEEKRVAEYKALLIQIAEDHESAIMEDKVRTMEKAEAARLQQERDETLKQDAIKQAKIDAEQAELKAQAEIERQKQAVIDAELKAKRDAEIAEQRRLADIEQAKADEIARQEAEAKAMADAEAARMANREHMSKINNEVLFAIILSSGVTEDEAKAIVRAMAKNEIPHIKINY